MIGRKLWLKYILPAGVIAGVLAGIAARVWSKPPPPPGGDFTAIDMAGRPWSFHAKQLGHPVLLAFVSTRCHICRASIPALLRLQKQYRRRGLQVVLVTEESGSVLRKDPLVNHAAVKVLTDSPEVYRLYKIPATPYLVPFDSKGHCPAGVDGRFNAALAIATKSLLL